MYKIELKVYITLILKQLCSFLRIKTRHMSFINILGNVSYSHDPLGPGGISCINDIVRISSVSMGPIRLGSEKVWVRFVLGPKRFGSESSQKFWVRVVLGPSCLTFIRRPSSSSSVVRRLSSVVRPQFQRRIFLKLVGRS